VSLSSQTLYRATSDIERATAVPIAEAAINEVMIKLDNAPTWGTAGSEKLYMIVGNQDPAVAGLKKASLPAPNSGFSFGDFGFEGKACYYVSFDPVDPAFKGKKYYSVNNLENSAETDSWRGPGRLPPWSASIVVTVAVGSTVRHFEVIARNVPAGGMGSGSRGFTEILTDKFKMDGHGNDRPTIHGNFDSPTDVSMHFAPLKEASITIDFKKNAQVTANEGITYDPSGMPSDFNPNRGASDIPELNIDDYFDPNTCSNVIPAGTYEHDPNTGTLMYTSPTGGGPEPASNHDIGSAIEFKDKEIIIKDDIVIDFDPTFADNDKTGNLTVIGAKVKFEKKGGGSLYAQGDVNEQYPSGAYKYGNIEIITPNDKILEGEGNVYARGGIQLSGKEIDAGYLSKDIALYSDGDILLSTTNDTKFKGLIYTKGDFHCVVNENIDPYASTDPNNPVDPNSFPVDKFKKFKVDGALIAAGKEQDPNFPLSAADPGTLYLSAAEVNIKINDAVLGGLTSSTGGTGLEVVSWHEF